MKEKTQTANAPNGHTDQPEVRGYDPKRITRSPFNRKIDDAAVTELTDSIREHGVIQPLIARQLPGGGVELIAGERRWKSALKANLKEVPVIIRKATDREVIELQTIENDQREDLTPLERAEKYAQLRDQYVKEGMNASAAVEEVAKRVGKKRSTVYETLALVKLAAPVKKAVASNKLPASHAGLVAKLADYPDLQERALADITNADPWEENERTVTGELVLSFRESKRLVDELASLAEKRKAWARTVTEARAKGLKVLNDRETAMARNRGCVRSTDCNYDYIEPNSYKALMGKHAPAPMIGRDEDFNVVELYEKEATRDAVKANGRKPGSPGLNRSAQSRGVSEAKRMTAQAAKTRRETAERRMIVNAVVEAARKPITKAKQHLEFATFMVRAMKQRVLSDTTREMFNRRGLKSQDYKDKRSYRSPHTTWLEQEIAGLKDSGQARALLVDMAIAMDLTMWSDEYNSKLPKMLDVACKIFGVDPKKAIKQGAPNTEGTSKSKGKSKGKVKK